MKKTRIWRAMRLQKKRENQRIRKQTKPDRQGMSWRQMETDKPGLNLFGWLSRPVAKEDKHDRREKNQRQGDR